jgi:hypothetical protein
MGLPIVCKKSGSKGLAGRTGAGPSPSANRGKLRLYDESSWPSRFIFIVAKFIIVVVVAIINGRALVRDTSKHRFLRFWIGSD